MGSFTNKITAEFTPPKTWKLEEYNLKIEVVKIQELYVFIKEKLLNNPKYLWRKIQNE